MNKNKFSYKSISIFLLVGMVIHLTALHPFAEGWVMCYEENDTHFENVNFNEDCHSAIPISNLVMSTNCKDDVLLEHQDEFYTPNKSQQKRILPASAIIFPHKIENEIITSHFNLIKRVEIKPLPLSIKQTVNLLI